MQKSSNSNSKNANVKSTTQTCSPNAIRDFLTSNKDIKEIIEACVLERNSEGNSLNAIKTRCKNALINKEMQMVALDWFENLSVADRLNIIKYNYGDQKIIDTNNVDRELLKRISDTDIFMTEDYWNDEEQAEDGNDINNFVINHDYNNLYTLTKIHYLLQNLPNIKKDGKKQIYFVNTIAFATGRGEIDYISHSQDNMHKHLHEFRVEKYNKPIYDNVIANKTPWTQGRPVISCENIDDVKDNYKITFGEFISKLLAVAPVKKLEEGI